MLDSKRYLFVIPKFKEGGLYDEDMLLPLDMIVSLSGISKKPLDVKLLGDGSRLAYEYSNTKVTVHLPAKKRTKLVDVVEIELEK